MATPRRDWYEEAQTYARAFSFDPEPEAALLTEAFARHGIAPPAKLIEPMAGNARLFPPLLERGFSVFGFDRARPMLRAAAKTLQPRLFQADAAKFQLQPDFDGAFCLIDSFRYLLTDAAVDGFFDSLRRTLRPGGVLVLGLEVAGRHPVADDRWTVQDGEDTLQTTVRSTGTPAPGQQWIEATIEIDGPSGRRTMTSKGRQRLWSGEALTHYLEGLTAFERTGLWMRTQDLGSPLQDFPQSGASVLLTLQRRPH